MVGGDVNSDGYVFFFIFFILYYFFFGDNHSLVAPGVLKVVGLRYEFKSGSKKSVVLTRFQFSTLHVQFLVRFRTNQQRS